MTMRLIPMFGLLIAGVVRAATVDVSYVDADRYADGGEQVLEARMVKSTLSEHFAVMAQRYLPAGQQLKIEVLDIDLAGEIRFRGVAGQDQRVLRGSADWPRIELRYTLQDGERLVGSGEARVTDMNYMGHGYAYWRNDPLFYERRMLEHWFRDQFAAQGR